MLRLKEEEVSTIGFRSQPRRYRDAHRGELCGCRPRTSQRDCRSSGRQSDGLDRHRERDELCGRTGLHRCGKHSVSHPSSTSRSGPSDTSQSLHAVDDSSCRSPTERSLTLFVLITHHSGQLRTHCRQRRERNRSQSKIMPSEAGAQ